MTALIDIMDNTKNDRREIRYKIESIYSKYISCKLLDNGLECVNTTVMDFSLNGLKIECPVLKAKGALIDCVISLPDLYPQELRAKVKVKYILPSSRMEKYILGTEIVETNRHYLARIFTKIIEFISTRTGNVY